MRELNAWKKYICSLKEGLSPWYRLSRASSIIRDCKGFLYILASKLLYQDPSKHLCRYIFPGGHTCYLGSLLPPHVMAACKLIA